METGPNEPRRTPSHKRLVLVLTAVVLFMGGFGYFVLVPLYNLVCSLTGLNGKTEIITPQALAQMKPDGARSVRVHFEASILGGLPWKFRPMVPAATVHPGQIETVNYYVKNLGGQVITGRATDSVVPNRAAQYFRKIQCFCFTNHTLKPHQSEQLQVKYVVLPSLPANVHNLFLWYTFSQFSAHPAQPSGRVGGAG